MAHHKSAKKRIRRNGHRQEINIARRSRVRTHLRKVEEAISSGDQESCSGSASGGGAGNHARRKCRNYEEEYGISTSFPAVGAGQGDEQLVRIGRRQSSRRNATRLRVAFLIPRNIEQFRVELCQYNYWYVL